MATEPRWGYELDTSFLERLHHTDPRRLYSTTATDWRIAWTSSACAASSEEGTVHDVLRADDSRSSYREGSQLASFTAGSG